MIKHKNIIILLFCCFVTLALAGCATAPPTVPLSAPSISFQEWWKDFAAEAGAKGISETTLLKVEAGFAADPPPDERVVKLDRAQPEKKQSAATYWQARLTEARIAQGREALREHAAILAKLERHFGIEPKVLVALWGVETSYGDNRGKLPILKSLATLAYEGRRASFFREQLMAALLIMQQEGIAYGDFIGSWAGAFGHLQFMPTTFLSYALDGTGDGVRAVWNNPDDALASAANYLRALGWSYGKGWGMRVSLSPTSRLTAEDFGLERQATLREWLTRGVMPPWPANFDENAFYSLIQPDGEGTDAYLVNDNFKVLLKWNRSTAFALLVSMLTERL